MLFHLKIAEASKNVVLKSLMLIITPDIIKNFIQYKVCDDETEYKAFHEHQLVLKHITDKYSQGAAEVMRKHLRDVIDFSRSTVFQP